MQLLKTTGPHPYPHKFDVSTSLTEFIEKYEDSLEPGELLEAESCSVAGQIGLGCVHCVFCGPCSYVILLFAKKVFVCAAFSKFDCTSLK